MTNSSEPRTGRRGVPPFWLSLAICVGLTAAMAWLRLVVFPNQVVPLATGLPLLICLWNRDLRLLYGMAAALTVIAFYKLWNLPLEAEVDTTYETMRMVSIFINIWLLVGVIHGLLRARTRLQRKREQLELTNAELEASNEELAAREEEIARQNEELQSQTEELEQQAEELRQQAEEMEQQAMELQETNTELGRKEKGMQTLLDSGRWLRSGMSEELVLDGICQAAIQVMGEDVHAVAVVERDGRECVLRGHSGFGQHGATKLRIPFERSLGALLMERGQTAFIEDLQSRPDLEFSQPASGRPFRSVLATPIWVESKPIATLEIYSTNVRKWSEHEFRIAEWLAGQAALGLQAIRFHQELELKRRDAEEASVQKTRFLAAVSHDVRTPANAISLLADLIERMSGHPEKRHEVPELVKTLGSNAKSLVDLVSDVLDLARFDAGGMDLQVTEFSLSALVAAEVRQALPVAQSKGLALGGQVKVDEGLRLRTDRMKLARVLSNLIGNAVKFTESGGVDVHCERTERGIELSVVDSGIGIPEDQLQSIFDEFFQLRNPERNREKGTGLGLAICRRLLDGLGCGVSVNSVVGVGTKFVIRIPDDLIAGDDERTPAVPEGGDDQGGGRVRLEGVRVLLVEDHQVTRHTVARLLAEEGAVVSQAENGREALQALGHGPHDVMLLDLNLPDIDGREVLKSLQVRKPEELRCVLVVSGDARPERAEEVRSLGADDLVPKPVTMERILEALAAHRVI